MTSIAISAAVLAGLLYMALIVYLIACALADEMDQDT